MKAAAAIRCAGAGGPDPIGEQLNEGDVVEARPAATLILLRDSQEGPEVLLVKRNPEQALHGRRLGLPRRSRDEGRGRPEAAALRELEEEAGIAMTRPRRAGAVLALDHARGGDRPLRHLLLRRRRARRAPRPRPTATSASTPAGCGPAAALEAAEDGELLLVFPTIKNLEPLTEFGSVEQALAAVRARRSPGAAARGRERQGRRDLHARGARLRAEADAATAAPRRLFEQSVMHDVSPSSPGQRPSSPSSARSRSRTP